MSNTKEEQLKQAINEYYDTVYKSEEIKRNITNNLVTSDAVTPEFTESILDNEGLGTDVIFDILKKFVKE